MTRTRGPRFAEFVPRGPPSEPSSTRTLERSFRAHEVVALTDVPEPCGSTGMSLSPTQTSRASEPVVGQGVAVSSCDAWERVRRAWVGGRVGAGVTMVKGTTSWSSGLIELEAGERESRLTKMEEAILARADDPKGLREDCKFGGDVGKPGFLVAFRPRPSPVGFCFQHPDTLSLPTRGKHPTRAANESSARRATPISPDPREGPLSIVSQPFLLLDPTEQAPDLGSGWC